MNEEGKINKAQHGLSLMMMDIELTSIYGCQADRAHTGPSDSDEAVSYFLAPTWPGSNGL